MNYEKAKKILDKNGQSQLLKYFDELNEPERIALLDDISRIDFSILTNLNKKQKKAKRAKYACVPVKTLKDISKNRKNYEKEGYRLLKENKVAAVLLAGGQGTRLGYDKPKGTFDIGETVKLSIFGQLMNNIKDVTRVYGGYFHLFIMTSTVNDKDTRLFFKQNDYFGYPSEKIHFFIQDTQPVCDLNGKILLSAKHSVAFAPNGNGGWYSSLVGSGLTDILTNEKIEWLNVFSVDNVLQRICDPSFIGATFLSRNFCGAKVVKKNCAEEKVGVLLEENGKPCVLEYFEIPPSLNEKRNAKGELVYCYGVTLNYLFNVHVLNAVYSWELPYHIAKKKFDYIENGELVKSAEPNAYKFETLVVDIVKYMGGCLAYEVDREKEFAPIKNKTGADSVDTARALLKLNGVKL